MVSKGVNFLKGVYMWTIIIFIIIGALYLDIWSFHFSHLRGVDDESNMPFAIRIFIVGCICITMGYICAACLPSDIEERTDTVEIVKWDNNSYVSTTRLPHSITVYSYYYKSGSIIRYAQLNVDDVIIRYTIGTPHLERIYGVRLNTMRNNFSTGNPKEYYVIYIPER